MWSATLIEKRRLNFVSKLLDVSRLARLFVWLSLRFFITFYIFYSILFSLCLLCVCSYACLSAVVAAHVANKDKDSVTLDLKEIANEFTARNERHTDTGWPKKSKPQNFVHIFAKYHRFSNFFHCCILWKICSKVVTRHNTTP